MNKQSLRTVAAAVVVVALLAGFAFVTGVGWPTVPAVQAQETPPTPQPIVMSAPLPSTITVVGEGKVEIEPDIARVSIGVETLRDTVEEASAANQETLDAVLAALQAQGIAEEDIQTSGFSIFAERYGPEGPLPDDQVRYRVSNNVSVTIRDLENVGTVLDAAIEAGANNIYGVEFALDDPSIVESDARASAVEDARAKAEDLAALSGVELGELISISEVIAQGGGFYAGTFAEQARGFGGGGTPVMPGQLELVMQLQVVYAIAAETE
ncbi:MAG TPA: SIMPL domain-containing protein [Caldilineaceae bacterium]|nr:SIMPL domain-containing protein [Caldilineaceae bacterium]